MRRANLLKKLNGFQKADKQRFLLLTNNVLTPLEFVLYEFLIAITDWDERHTDTYGTVYATNLQIAQALGWKVDSTISRHRTRLIKKGFLFLNPDGSFKVKGFENWKLRKPYSARTHLSIAERQPSSANNQNLPANSQENAVYNNNYSLVSSKDPLGFSSRDEELANEIMDSYGVSE